MKMYALIKKANSTFIVEKTVNQRRLCNSNTASFKSSIQCVCDDESILNEIKANLNRNIPKVKLNKIQLEREQSCDIENSIIQSANKIDHTKHVFNERSVVVNEEFDFDVTDHETNCLIAIEGDQLEDIDDEEQQMYEIENVEIDKNLFSNISDEDYDPNRFIQLERDEDQQKEKDSVTKPHKGKEVTQFTANKTFIRENGEFVKGLDMSVPFSKNNLPRTNSFELFVANSNDGIKKYACLYCGLLQTKLPRHLESKHSDIPEVRKFSTLKKMTPLGRK
uniref:Uncharacterized protein n=1 Tax=Xenopsylla cheopis TaxID=163159 RepID=A0A6M2DRZ1_XENCH